MKKLLAVLIAAMLVLTAFAGCSDENNEVEIEENIAVKIGNTEFTLNDINYMYISFFNNLYNNLYQLYGENVGAIVDLYSPLEDQMFDDTLSWHEYIMEGTIEGLANLTALYEAALAENFVLPEEYQSSLDTMREDVEAVAADGDMTIDEYITLMYGEAMDFDSLYKMTEFQYIATAYANEYKESIVISEEDIEAYYAENKSSIDSVNFRFYSSQYSEAEGSLTAEEAKAQADALAAVHTIDEFNALAYEYAPKNMKDYFEGGDGTLFSSGTPETIGIEELSNWLFEEGRQLGETMVYHDETYSSYITVMFEEIVSADYNFVDVRHILIMPEEDEEGNSTEEDWAEAEKKAKEIYAEYLAGDKTEQSFKILAAENSQDGNASVGGIYEDVYKGQMVAPFENWCFDEARQPGDTDIVKTSFGYHIMYFVGQGENNLVSLVEPVLAEEAFNNWIISISENIEVERLDLLENAGGMIDDIINAAKALAEEQAAESQEETGNVTNEEVVSGDESAEG